MLPDVIVRILSAVTPRSRPTSAGVGFAAGVTTRGPAKKAMLCRSMVDFAAIFGARIAAVPSMWDWAETYFNEGGSELYWGRVFGSGAKPAELTLNDSAAAATLLVKAGQYGEEDPGVWGNGAEPNGLAVIVEKIGGGENFVIKVTNATTKVVLEESPTCENREQAIAWAKANSKYIVLSITGASVKNPFTLAEKALAAGTAGAAVATADRELGLKLLERILGPGQEALPGQTAEADQKALIASAVAHGRLPIPDLVDSPSSATLVSAAQALYTAASEGRKYAQPSVPWDVIPGLTPSTTRTVPSSARLMGQYARLGENTGRGAAGARGTAQYVVDLSQPSWTDAERLSLNNAGITVSRRRFGGQIVTWGVRTLADQTLDESWSFAPGVRTVLTYAAQAEVAVEEWEFDQVDGQGHALTDIKGELVGLAMQFYNRGALYGLTPQEAFSVNVDPSLNTPAKLAKGELVAQVGLRASPTPEQIVLNIVKVPITQALS